MTPIVFKPIGHIRSEHRAAEATPIQPVYAEDCHGSAVLLPEFADGLADIEGFSHLYLLYVLDRATQPRLLVRPFLHDCEHGIFATRSPCRPNPLGMSLVRLLRREGAVLQLAGVDILDGTPLLDIKPYSPRFDAVEAPRGGWTDAVSAETARQLSRRGYLPSAPAPLSTQSEP